MDAKSLSNLPPASAKQKHAFEYPLSRILEPLGFSRHPIRFIICLCVLIILFTFVCRQHCDADSCRYYRQNITNGLGLFALVYGVWFKVAMDQRPYSGNEGQAAPVEKA